MNYKRHRYTYSFRAWIDERGSNVDRKHDIMRADHWSPCLEGQCRHLRLWDLNTNGKSHNIIRIVRRRHPFALGVYVGRTMRLHAQIGMSR